MKKRRRSGFSYVGSDKDHHKISAMDGTLDLSYEKKFELVCDLTLFRYQLRHNTNDLPRFLRTTACIRKA